MKYLFLISLFVVVSCKPTQTNTNDAVNEVDVEEVKEGCETLGTVKDLSGLDGCGLMIVLENGRKVDPVVIEDKSFELKDGQKVKFTYEQEREVMSICMGGQTVRVTCIEEIR